MSESGNDERAAVLAKRESDYRKMVEAIGEVPACDLCLEAPLRNTMALWNADKCVHCLRISACAANQAHL